ncbi:hypothetical protein HA402_015658 [Bradysia odoriphaga]|nr:hypothetical protein HA402_015658 [Bradysia odoriphaga]
MSVPLNWEKANVRSRISSRAVQGGRDTDGTEMFVGRAFYNNVWLPAKVLPSKNACYVAYNGVEVHVDNFEVLIGSTDFVWEPASDGGVPAGAVTTGRDGNEEIFVGRGPFLNSITVGKVHPSHRCLYLGYNGREEKVRSYEVLVYRKLSWISSSIRDVLPRDAVLGGRDSDGSPIYVGRASHDGATLICKVLPSKQAAYVATNGVEISKLHYEVLVGRTVRWKADKNGKVPRDAFAAGRATNGETLYIGRAPHNGSLTIGKVHPTHGCLYMPYGGSEVSLREYEVLTGI